MKMIIVSMVLAMMVMAVGVSAQTLPMIITGNIIADGSPQGYTVTLTNLRTDAKASYITNNAGYFRFDPQNMIGGAYPGDDYMLEVGDAKIDIKDIGFIPVELKIDLVGHGLRPDADCPECPSTNCPVCDICPTPTVCPAPIVCPEPVICPDICDDCPMPTEEDYDWAWAAIIAVLASSGATAFLLKNRIGLSPNTGFKIYVGENGEEKKVHKHSGIVGYHSPDTLHNNINMRHPRGMLLPKYHKVDGKWLYGDG